jgi:hypothetical protein
MSVATICLMQRSLSSSLLPLNYFAFLTSVHLQPSVLLVLLKVAKVFVGVEDVLHLLLLEESRPSSGVRISLDFSSFLNGDSADVRMNCAPNGRTAGSWNFRVRSSIMMSSMQCSSSVE